MQKKKTDKVVRNKERKGIAVGVVHVLTTFNNIIVNVTDLKGNTISWSSAGSHGFRGAKKSTPHAAQITTAAAIQKAKEHGIRTVSVEVKGPGSGRESSLRAIVANDVTVASVKDVTPLAHNGVKKRKPRKV